MSLFSFCFHNLFIAESGVVKSPTTIVCCAMWALSFIKVSLMNVAALAFRAYIFRIWSSSWRILTLMSMKCPSLSFLTSLGGKSILSDIRHGYSSLFLQTICLENCFPAFHSEVASVFFREMGFCKQQKVGSCLCSQSISLCLFIGGIESIDIKRY